MTDAVLHDWEAELKILLDTIRNHPSRDLTHERERVVVLTKLIAEYVKKD